MDRGPERGPKLCGTCLHRKVYHLSFTHEADFCVCCDGECTFQEATADELRTRRAAGKPRKAS